MAAAGELRITEEWIRERLNLRIDCLAEVRSLALPGSYHEKVTHLGRSLIGFTRLKQLDLSRNALRSLEGLDHLKMLETLNIYYNNVSGLQELFRLRHNAALKELDLRLNPVTKEEPDYRLFVVHMLVHLRTLDDRPVKESERKAALMHFDTDQAYEMMLNVEQGMGEGNAPPPMAQNHPQQRTPLPQHVKSRQVLVRSLAPRPTDETTNLLELLHERDHAHEEGTSGQPHNAHRVLGSPLKASSEIDGAERQKVARGEELPYRHKGHFTPHPQPTAAGAAVGGEPSSVKQRPARSSSPDVRGQQSVSAAVQLAETVVRMVQKHTALSAGKKMELQRELAHWFNSTQSLPQPRYELEQLSELQRVLHSRESELAMKEDLLARKEEELVAVVTQLEEQSGRAQQLELERTSEERRRRKLEQAERDLVAVQELVDKLRSENSTLHTELQRAAESNKTALTLRKDVERLRQENIYLQKEATKSDLHQAESDSLSQMKQLVAMLQESHHSLVATNAQLLREMEEAKERHSREVEQMHTNYEHLRRTVDIIHST